MPDDYFNRQQNQRKPRYAAGSDMDSIYTGREVPDGGFQRKKRMGCLPKIIITILVIMTIVSALPSEPLKGEINGEITSFYYSNDQSSATVVTHIVNNTNKTIHSIKLTYTIIDNEGNTLAENIIKLPDKLAVGTSLDHAAVIETPSMPTGYTEAHVGIRYSY